MSSGQAIRPTQFVLTYGVGAIFEAPNGPRVIPSFKDWGRIFNKPDTSLTLAKYEIRDQNVSNLLRGGKIFRLPTNADLEVPDDRIIFRTKRFPQWGFCQTHLILYKLTSLGTSRCPGCHDPTKPAQQEAIRFIRACPKGHVDDVDWVGIVHKDNPGCAHDIFEWIETGSSMWDIKIKCTKKGCNASASLEDIYNNTWKCSGRFIENDINEPCNEKASVILRNASNLRVVESVSALTIPPMTSPLHRILENPRILPILAAENSWTKDKLLDKLKNASKRLQEINPIIISEIEEKSEGIILNTINDVLRQPEDSITDTSVKEKELKELKHAAVNGAPPCPLSEPQDFEVDKDKVRHSVPLSNINLRIMPVKRLRVVTAQKGYVRPIRGPAKSIVETCYNDGEDRWYVGTELRGEGIFIDLSIDQNFSLKETETSKQWESASNETGSLFFNPLFVWWHSLSHRLITALSIDSGYSSASIRERVYLRQDPENGELSGGVLLYTTQTGGDGSLGGLIALVPNFERVLGAARQSIHSCSNDPLCGEQRLALGKPNGAACYACLLVSETSCEFGNIYLDRNLLRENII